LTAVFFLHLPSVFGTLHVASRFGRHFATSRFGSSRFGRHFATSRFGSILVFCHCDTSRRVVSAVFLSSATASDCSFHIFAILLTFGVEFAVSLFPPSEVVMDGPLRRRSAGVGGLTRFWTGG
jgi:hypothetical protein